MKSKLKFERKQLQIENPGEYVVVKDPCPVFDGKQWHLYGSGCLSDTCWDMFHAVTDDPYKEWKVVDSATPHNLQVPNVSQFAQVCAPGVVYDEQEKLFHMFMQTHCFALGGAILHLASSDGKHFFTTDVPIVSELETDHAGVYDPHPAVINGKKYIVYSAFKRVSHGDLYVVESKSNTWYGPWVPLGRILSHEDVEHHNQHDHHDYEWGLEGAQLIGLPSGKVLLNAVCFLPEDAPRGTRQRVFFAIADSVAGPYKTLGPVLDPVPGTWESGENGHAAGVVVGDKLLLFYQGRSFKHGDELWKPGIATINISDIENAETHSEKIGAQTSAIL
jgi:hypothetical protein